MADVSYSSYRNGKYVNVPKIDDLCLSLKDKFLRQEEDNDRLRNENKKLKEGIWEKEEINSLKRENEKLRKDYYRGFPISEEEDVIIREWINSHKKENTGTIGGRYEYRFFPTSIGIVGKIVDTFTKDECVFRELD